ncbi:hypothetical protein AOQ72_21405 [Bradyrhizobium yuanmingense]|uniref:Uncharacterized protein n=1 Tax=Bradyrhizobium yuanmingense TaxID=108015 RepID=A0A0R3C8A4_9BRAD|nr:hypothetical protein AOQ72_21405 [Bradyrhizobium yuanmingense]
MCRQDEWFARLFLFVPGAEARLIVRFNLSAEQKPLSLSAGVKGVHRLAGSSDCRQGYRQGSQSRHFSFDCRTVGAPHTEKFRTTIRTFMMRFFPARAEFGRR